MAASCRYGGFVAIHSRGFCVNIRIATVNRDPYWGAHCKISSSANVRYGTSNPGLLAIAAAAAARAAHVPAGDVLGRTTSSSIPSALLPKTSEASGVWSALGAPASYNARRSKQLPAGEADPGREPWPWSMASAYQE